MRKKILICLSIIIIIIGIVSITKYNEYKNKLSYTIEQVTEENYFLLMQNNKYGVMDRNGNTLIEPKYDVIEIPNASKPVFICKKDYNSDTGEYTVQVFNENNETILYEYYIVEAIKLNNVESNGNYEKSVLKYKSGDKYGLIDFEGNKITEAIYDSIEGFEYKEGLLLVEKSGKYGIININGATIVKEKYDEILCDGYYTEELKYENAGYIVGIKTDNGMRYGYIDAKTRKQILDNEYNEIYRITEKVDNDNVYLVAFENGKAGVYKNKENIIENTYEDILYNSSNDLLILQKNSKQGVAKFDGTVIVSIEYDNIFFAGSYINAQKDDNVDIYNVDGSKEENSEYISKQDVADGKYEIVSTSDDEYKIINKETGNIISDNYQYIQYLFENYFCVTKNNLYGIVDADGNEVLKPNYNVIQLLDDTTVIQTIDENSNTELLNNNFETITKVKNANIYIYDNYIKVYTDSDVQYISKSGEVLENTEIYTQNELFAYKENNKWGFKDKDGNIVVNAIYDMVTEFNEYGYAGIKSNGKWGSIDQNGNIITDPTYEIDTAIMPNFIKQYYEVDYGYGDSYYIGL